MNTQNAKLSLDTFSCHIPFNQGLRGHLCLAETGLSVWKCLAHALRVLRVASDLLPSTGQFPHDQPESGPIHHGPGSILPWAYCLIPVPGCMCPCACPPFQTLDLFTVHTHWGRSWGGFTLGPWAFLPVLRHTGLCRAASTGVCWHFLWPRSLLSSLTCMAGQKRQRINVSWEQPSTN